ncbi:hypothetical protein HQQ80_11840 [Microbacteriaceae bacterium VKM Ac-2855]|nr:hypothetical protein [Microbacteriaceae bacterium VKM Ac-2855]
MSNPTGGWDFSRFNGGGPAGSGGESSQAGPTSPTQPIRFGTAGESPVDRVPAAETPTGCGGTVAAPSPSSVRTPVGWLIAGIAVALVSAAAALVLGTEPGIAVAAWALAGPVAIGLFAVYLLLDTRRRTQLMYSPPTWAPWVYRGGLVVVLLAVIACSGRIALWAGRVWQL